MSFYTNIFFPAATARSSWLCSRIQIINVGCQTQM